MPFNRHGFAHTECHILYDQTLAFHDIVTERIANDRAAAEALAKEITTNGLVVGRGWGL